MDEITFAISPAVESRQICDLRAAVGWDRAEGDYPRALAGYWATVGGFDASGALVAWCALLSDGVRHAVLLDVIVHPAAQRRGVGRALVGRAIQHCRAHDIALIHVDFLPDVEGFYARCGFRVGLGGIIDDEGNADR